MQPPGLTDDVLERLRTATRVTVLTGAGVSQESGVPTFRQAQTGQWADYEPSELASPQAFLRTPRRIWEWYAYRRQMIDGTQPSPTHYALVDLEQYYPEFTLITQNIDGLHWRAGSRELIELHGNIGRSRCFDCGTFASVWDEEGELPPCCVRCGGMLRPDVVWLGEGLPEHELRRAYQAAERAQVFLSIGTSASVRPGASLPLIARRSGAYLIEIDPNETALSVLADCWLQHRSSDLLQELVNQIMQDDQ